MSATVQQLVYLGAHEVALAAGGGISVDDLSVRLNARLAALRGAGAPVPCGAPVDAMVSSRACVCFVFCVLCFVFCVCVQCAVFTVCLCMCTLCRFLPLSLGVSRRFKTQIMRS